MYCLRLFIVYKNYNVYYNVYCYYCGVFIEKHTHTKFNLHWLLCERVTWPIVMYDLRLFNVVLQELHCLPNYLHVFMIRVIGCYHITKFRYSTPSGF